MRCRFFFNLNTNKPKVLTHWSLAGGCYGNETNVTFIKPLILMYSLGATVKKMVITGTKKLYCSHVEIHTYACIKPQYPFYIFNHSLRSNDDVKERLGSTISYCLPEEFCLKLMVRRIPQSHCSSDEFSLYRQLSIEPVK